MKLTAFNMAEERADGYFDEVRVAWELSLLVDAAKRMPGREATGLHGGADCTAATSGSAVLCCGTMPALLWSTPAQTQLAAQGLCLRAGRPLCRKQEG